MKPYKKSIVMKKLEKEYEIPIHELLRILRVDQGMSYRQMAEYLGITYRTARKFVYKVGIYSTKLVFYDRKGKEVDL